MDVDLRRRDGGRPDGEGVVIFWPDRWWEDGRVGDCEVEAAKRTLD